MVISQAGISFSLSFHPYSQSPKQQQKREKSVWTKVNNNIDFIGPSSRECCERGFVV